MMSYLTDGRILWQFGTLVSYTGHLSISNLQKRLLFKNQQWDFDETSYVAFWHRPLSSLFKLGHSDHKLSH